MRNNVTVYIAVGMSPTGWSIVSREGVSSGGSGLESHRGSMAVQYMYPVTAGNTYTYYANAWKTPSSDTSDVTLYYGYMTAVFYAT